MRNPYANIPSTVWLLAVVTLISKSGTMVLVFLPLYLTKQLNFDLLTTGQIISFYGLGQIIGALYGGVLTDKFGSKNIQFFSFLFAGFIYLLLEFCDLKYSIMFGLLCIGTLSSAIRPANGRLIIRFCIPTVRTRAYALNYQAINLGNSIGPTLGGLLAGISYIWLFRAEGLINIIAALAIIILLPKEPEKSETDFKALNNRTSIFKNTFFLTFLALIFLIGACLFQLLSIYPLFLNNYYHLSKIEIGTVMALNGLLIMLFQMALVSSLKKINPLRIISTGGVLICFGYFILPWYSGFHYALFSMVIITIGEMMVLPFAFEMVTKMSPEGSQGKYLGLFNCALSALPLFVTPNLTSYICTVFGPNFLWSGMGIIGLIIFFGFETLNRISPLEFSPNKL